MKKLFALFFVCAGACAMNDRLSNQSVDVIISPATAGMFINPSWTRPV